MNGKERIRRALRREVPDVVPVFEWFIDPVVAKAICDSDDPLDIIDHLDLDAVNLRPDYRREHLDETTFVDEWGIKRQLTGDCLPALLESPIKDVRDHRQYAFPDPRAAHRFASLEHALKRFGDQRAIVLNLRDGFSDMRDLLGYQEALMALLLDPEPLAELLDRSVAYNLQLAEIARARYGTEVVATTDDVANATGLLMRPETYFALLGPRFRAVVAGYKSLGYLCIKHCDGNVDAVVDFWVDCGIDCLDPVDPAAGYTIGHMKARFGDRICLKGNIDCTGVLCEGTPEEVERDVVQCLREGADGGGLIVSSSNTIHRGVKPENFQAMVLAVRRHGRRA
ncbi:MAG: hypothetical protein FJ276_04055 [Planctomycetes bacterium]|nr:hypothetical protein [Planctomycetota bacterium]